MSPKDGVERAGGLARLMPKLVQSRWQKDYVFEERGRKVENSQATQALLPLLPVAGTVGAG